MVYKAISVIALSTVAVLLGAYGSQHYIWTAPAQVVPLTNAITTDALNAVTNSSGSENFGSHPTATTAAVPASDNTTGENATITLQENSIIHFMVTDEDAGILDNYFENLTVNICLYERGIVDAPVADNLNLYVVVNGVGQTNIDNQTGIRSAKDWDAVVTLSYNTGGSAASGNIIVNVCAVEDEANSTGGKTYKWTIPYEITIS